MRAVIGLAFGLGLYTLAGWALLFALGLIATIRDALWATGLALLSGIALVGVTLVALLVIGLDVTLPVFVGVALLWSAALATAGSLAGGRASRRTPLTVPPLSRYERWIAWSVGVALTFFVLLEAVLSRNLPIGHDASHTSGPQKSVALFALDRLDPNVFNNVDYATAADPDPAARLRVHDVPCHRRRLRRVRADAAAPTGRSRSRHGLVPAARVVGTCCGPSRSSRWCRWCSPKPSLERGRTLAAYADVGALAAALWVRERDLRLLLLAGLLLGAATNVKTQGTGFAAIVMVSAALACAPWRGWRVLLPWAAGAGVLVALKIPWAAWMAIEEPAQHQAAAPLCDVLNPSFLVDRLDNLELGAKSVSRCSPTKPAWSG